MEGGVIYLSLFQATKSELESKSVSVNGSVLREEFQSVAAKSRRSSTIQDYLHVQLIHIIEKASQQAGKDHDMSCLQI